MEQQGTFEDVSTEYAAFVEKFKPRKTTDDCYTPQNIYDCVLDWASRHYGFEPGAAVRPFWPGGDFESFDYPEGCVVVDNPPFSIVTRICRWYNDRGVHYFLFSPGLTLTNGGDFRTHHVCCGTTVTFENGAKVNVGFVTDLGDWLVETAPALRLRLEALDTANQKALKKRVRKLALPDAVLTTGRANYLAAHGMGYHVGEEDVMHRYNLDNCPVFGGCYLLKERAAAERAAAERAAAERAAAERVELSDREKAVVEL